MNILEIFGCLFFIFACIIGPIALHVSGKFEYYKKMISLQERRINICDEYIEKLEQSNKEYIALLLEIVLSR